MNKQSNRSNRGELLRFIKATSIAGLLPTLFLVISSLQTARAGSAAWSTNPISSDWSDPANWTPNTVPNGPNDVATFATSSQTNVEISASSIELDSVVFGPGASAFTLRDEYAALTLSGAGIVNNSGIIQNFVLDTGGSLVKMLFFHNSASAGVLTSFSIGGGNVVWFYDSSSAGSGNFILDGNTEYHGGWALFYPHTTAGNATITANDAPNGYGGLVYFLNASADHATLIANGTIPTHQSGGLISFRGATAAQATIIVNGTTANKGDGGPDFSAARCIFQRSDGGTSRVELFGDGFMDTSFSEPGIAVGSIEGDGIVYLGAVPLSVGTNNLSTTFSGRIRDQGENGGHGSSLNKVGAGTLVVSGDNTYTGGTTITEGFLRVDNSVNSGTGKGPVQVNAGTLGGKGIIFGAVTIGSGIGSGAFLAPGSGTSTLTIQRALTFKADATYTYRIKTRNAQGDKVVADGATIQSGAQFSLLGVGNGTLAPGTVFTAVNNTSVTAISGTFSNLPDGATITIGSNTFQANYKGGDGNDLTLTVLP